MPCPCCLTGREPRRHRTDPQRLGLNQHCVHQPRERRPFLTTHSFVLSTGLEPGAHLSCCHDGSEAQKPVRQIGDINSSMQGTPTKVSPCAPWSPDSVSRMSPDLAAHDQGRVLPWTREASLVAGMGTRAPAPSTSVTVVT